MLAHERQLLILRRVDERGTVRTVDLAHDLEVTDETIRRDLQALEDSGQLKKVHGGATSLSGRPKLRSFSERRVIHVDRKEVIARAALEMIEPGLTLAFDSSTTAFELVRMLPDLPFRVVTNAHPVLHQLVDHASIELIGTGGRYHPKTQTYIGPQSHATLARHNINLAFVSCVGLDPERGASEAFEEQAVFKEVLVDAAERVVLLADSSKLGQRSEYFFAPLPSLSRVITDTGAAPEMTESLDRRGVAVTVAGAAQTLTTD